ncbi:DNA polymerase II [Thalassotalea fusca]
MLNNLEQIANRHPTGFLLTRRALDVNGRLQLQFWIKSNNHNFQLLINDELALFFIEENAHQKAKQLLENANISYVKMVPLTLKTFGGEPVVGVYFRCLRDLYSAREHLKSYHIKCYEDDIRPDDRYLMERFITAGLTCSGSIGEAGENHTFLIENAKCRPARAEVKLQVVSLDIECSMQGKLFSIGFYSEHDARVFMIGEKRTCDDPSIRADEFVVDWFEDEPALLKGLVNWFAEYDPDIVIGWNIVNFDFNVLQKRFDHHRIDFAIGRSRQIPRWRKNRNSEQQFLDIDGRVVLDGIDLLKTATYSFTSFSLDFVANALLGVGKKVEDVDNRVAEIVHNFHHNKWALAAYNLQDCKLVYDIFSHTQLIDFAMLRAQLTGLAIDRIGGSVAAFTNLYLPKLHRHGYVAPNLGDGLKGLVSPGGYVMDSIPGLYKNVLVLDFKSLYPSIIRTFNIDPIGMVEGLKSPQQAIAGFDGAYFSRTQHFLPEIITQLWQERDKAKRDQNAPLSQAIKIIMNSFYGILGSTGCRFFDPRLSGSITKRSHAILKQTKVWIEALGHRVIYGDTDSIFVHIGDEFSLEDSKKLGSELQQFINTQWQQEIEAQFETPCLLEIEFETHFRQFFMPAIRGAMQSGTANQLGTKKRYVGQVIEDGDSRLIFKGLETVRSDWTALAKSFQQALYQKVFDQDSVIEINQYIRTIVEQTLNGEFDHQLVYRKRLRRKLAHYVKNVPPHVKAARFADDKNDALGKPLKYQNKGWIEYVITHAGPQAIEHVCSPLNYQHYIDKQLKAVADDILPFINTSFEQAVDQQLSLF